MYLGGGLSPYEGEREAGLKAPYARGVGSGNTASTIPPLVIASGRIVHRLVCIPSAFMSQSFCIF